MSDNRTSDVRESRQIFAKLTYYYRVLEDASFLLRDTLSLGEYLRVEGSTILRNEEICSPNDTVSLHKRPTIRSVNVSLSANINDVVLFVSISDNRPCTAYR